MAVRLLTYTRPLVETMYTAAHCCYSPHTPDRIWDDARNSTIPRSEQVRVVLGCAEKDHNTVLRHAHFTFALSRMSRACAAQFLRHSTGIDHDQQSQRFVSMLKLEHAHEDPLELVRQQLRINEPMDPKGDPKTMETRLGAFLDECRALYAALIDYGFKPEEARRVLPIGSATNVVSTSNLAELRHIWDVRRCHSTGRAQNEIVSLVDHMVEAVLKAEPWLAPIFPSPKAP